MHRVIMLVVSLKIFFTGFSQTDSVIYSPVQTKYYFDWGNNLTGVVLSQYGPRNDIVMIHLHDNEFASAKAAEKVLGKVGGLLIEIENRGKRLIHFKKSGRIFHFDPNRIFTPHGLKKNLDFLNDEVTTAASTAVKTFSAFILQKIPNSATTLVSLHNNKNGAYSIKSYRTANKYARDVSKLYINARNDPDNFFIITNEKIFIELKKARYNVVLQSSKKASDDGSLSVYFGRRKKTYINVETEQGGLQQQIRMLERLVDVCIKVKTMSSTRK